MSRMRNAVLSLAVAGSAVLPPLPAEARQSGDPRARRVDELFAQWDSPASPGAAVLVIADGRTVHARGYGMANLEHGVPIGPATVFDIASVSKQFGAMAVALLEAEGKLSLDDDVRTWIPELPDFGHRITVRHLVHHTSGVRDWPGTLSMAGWSYEDVMSFEQILRMAFHQQDLNFRPGDAYAYSNTGYNLMAEIVARSSGKSFRAFTEERIFRPLGMTSTHFHDDHAEVVPNRAESYRPGPDGRWRRVVSSLTALGSSSLFTTVEDLAKWVGNFDSSTVGGPAVVARVHERGVLNGGDTIAYAFGQSEGRYRGLRTFSHTGSWAGYRSVLQRFPDEGFAVVILANTADMVPAQLASRIADVYLADRLAPLVAEDRDGGPAGGGGAAPARWAPRADELREYAGEYLAPELFTAWRVEVRGGGLVAHHFRLGERVFEPRERDVFQAPMFGEVRFQRDAQGRIRAFTANSDRIRELRFERSGG